MSFYRTRLEDIYSIKSNEILYRGHKIKYKIRNSLDNEKYEKISIRIKSSNCNKILDNLWKKFPNLTSDETNYLCFQYKDHKTIQKIVDNIKID